MNGTTEVASAPPSPTVVILAYRSRSDLAVTLPALRAVHGGPPDLVVVDNACPEHSADIVPGHYPEAVILRSPGNLGFAGGANLALRHLLSRGVDEVVFLNADARPDPDWLVSLMDAAAARPDAGVLGSLVLSGDGRNLDSYQGAFLDIKGVPRPGWTDDPLEVPMVIGASLWLRGDALRAVGGFDPLYFAYGEEADLCRRVLVRGFRVVLVPRSKVRHRGEGASRGTWLQLRVRWLRLRSEGLLHLKRPDLPLRIGVSDLPFRTGQGLLRDLSKGRFMDALLRLSTVPVLLARLPDIRRSRRRERDGPAHVVPGRVAELRPPDRPANR